MNKIVILLTSAFVMTTLGATSCILDGGDDDNSDPNIVKQGDTVPSFTLADNGNTGTEFVSTRDFEGKTSLLVFFNTGCGDCKREMPKVFAVWEDVKDEADVQIITIAREEGGSVVSTHWLTEGFGQMPWYGDPDRSVFSKFATQTVPRLYVIGSDARIRQMWVERLRDDNGNDMTASQFVEIFRQHVIAAQ